MDGNIIYILVWIYHGEKDRCTLRARSQQVQLGACKRPLILAIADGRARKGKEGRAPSLRWREGWAVIKRITGDTQLLILQGGVSLLCLCLHWHADLLTTTAAFLRGGRELLREPLLS